jgi:hypothetical protein
VILDRLVDRTYLDDSSIAAQDAVPLGRRTYDLWVAFWPSSDIETFASFINGVPKFVLSSTPPDVRGQLPAHDPGHCPGA